MGRAEASLYIFDSCEQNRNLINHKNFRKHSYTYSKDRLADVLNVFRKGYDYYVIDFSS